MSLTFLTPWLLSALLGLPVLWLLLRAVPPAPVRRFFPGVILLLGLRDKTQISDRTPWWLLLIRMLAIALIILGLAGPVLNPQSPNIKRSNLLILMDGGWAAARDWQAHQTQLERVLNQAARAGACRLRQRRQHGQRRGTSCEGGARARAGGRQQ